MFNFFLSPILVRADRTQDTFLAPLDNLLFLTSGVHDPTLHRQLTPQASPFPHFPGCPLRYSSLAPSHAELFLRSREGAGFPEKKETWIAELSEEKIIKRKKPRSQRNRSFFLYNLFKFCARNIFFSSSKESPAFSTTEIRSVREGCQGY